MCGITFRDSRRRSKRLRGFFASAGLAALVLSGTAGAGSAFDFPHFATRASGDTLFAVGAAGPTPAWIVFCAQLPRECAYNPSEPDTIVLDQATWKLIVDVNEQVNREIVPVTDQDHWGVADRWDYPDDGMGDCEDIQLLKRRRLTQAGLPQRALRMTVVIDELGAGHAVLMARTDRGDYILDNKRNAVLPWQQTGYRYVKREGSDSADWVWLGNQAAPVVTATK
ncbi:transglutaminase-like cysteine peptidase [Microvirga lotononidis]|uniref:Putative periplasmic protein n=1 Tax=Microvirga lotononidis TaxID=864069 RepID=I4YLQ2_9HYPH|nr:transglutaminase-like cysteine peptidase [Microvirga lotononidis]EIM24894.1 putative periplasmic protein [Microvirga lotononidis]WQO29605.1 transglutaminase-like cysteine peptidase [Microvirga lotononidis]